jgi:hypothetical protein
MWNDRFLITYRSWAACKGFAAVNDQVLYYPVRTRAGKESSEIRQMGPMVSSLTAPPVSQELERIFIRLRGECTTLSVLNRFFGHVLDALLSNIHNEQPCRHAGDR